MKTISTTRLAQATDPFSDKGALGLLSIFTKAKKTERMDPMERELKRGLFQSPEKTLKTKGKAFIRGGLADTATKLISRASTTQSLWESDFSKHTLALSAPINKPLVPDLNLRIVSIL
ncbi:hypothetical protein NLI96_g4371 [Meripilus lineatus]|uniref:Uncharacterized protein n=1 Tax=Meripilus lineatus TaxID=2056292 RepID=A0AAD5YI44_9APHY|nr:hypothetical protein NLI96_g4371 [Physisporinus lineatus]